MSCYERTDWHTGRQIDRQTEFTNFTYVWGSLRLAPITMHCNYLASLKSCSIKGTTKLFNWLHNINTNYYQKFIMHCTAQLQLHCTHMIIPYKDNKYDHAFAWAAFSHSMEHTSLRYFNVYHKCMCVCSHFLDYW